MEITDLNENKKENSVHEEENENQLQSEEKDNQDTEIQNSHLDNKKESTEEIMEKESNQQLHKTIPKKGQKKINQKNFVKQKNKQKPKSNVNPFLPENNLEYKRKKHNSKHEINRHSIRNSYLLNYKKEMTDLKDQSQNKSVFSKISEIMYQKAKEEKYPRKKEKDLQKEKEENYDKFTEEAYLCSHANKANKENQKIIEEFLERKRKEEIKEKVGIEPVKEVKNELEPFQDLKRVSIITDRNISFKPKRALKEFLEDQKSKEEKHQTHLKANKKLYDDKISSVVLDKPNLNEETIKIANKGNRNNGIDIHQRLYEEFKEIKQKKEKNEKEKSYFNKNEAKKISKSIIQKNVERLYNEYETKKKIIDENEQKKEKEFKIRSSSRSASKTSNKIIFRRFKKILENSYENILNKKLEDNFEINFSDFCKILYKINFTTKNYFDLIQQKENKNKEEEEIQESIISAPNVLKKILFKQNKFEFDGEYKLLTDAWKIIIKNKEFKDDISGPSQRMIIFFLSVLGIYDGNANNNFIKKEFPFLLTELNDANKYSNLSKQIYKYFSVFKNNAINGLLFREKDQKRRLEIQKETERILTFNPVLEKSSKNFILNSNSVNQIRSSVGKNYQQYKINKELKLKEKEKLLENAEKEKYPFAPSGTKKKTKQDVSEISKRLFNTGLKHLKLSNSTSNNFSLKEKIYNSLTENIQKPDKNFQKMFNKNPLESDMDVIKKVQDLEQSRNKKAFEKLILKKGFKPKIDIIEDNLYTEDNYSRSRFALEDELSNTFKNTFEKYERMEKLQSNRDNKGKCEFEIIINRKPQKLIIYPNDDIRMKVKEFCNTYKLDFNDKRYILRAINLQMNNPRFLVNN